MDASTSLKLFVYIIESPDPKDILDGNTEGKALTEALKLSGIRSNYSLAIDDETFDLALRDRLAEVIRLYPDRLPMLHVSCHGSDDGIQLTNGRFISWEELRRRLLPINEALRGFLVVTLSSCFGGFGWKAAMYVDGPLPFHGLVGHVGKVTWSDAAVAYIAFYHRFCKGAHIKDAVEAMRAASIADSRTRTQELSRKASAITWNVKALSTCGTPSWRC